MNPLVQRLAAELQARLDRGELEGLAPLHVAHGVFFEATLLARITLADVGHCAYLERQGRPRGWAQLAQLEQDLQRLLNQILEHDGRRGQELDG
jgi:hypothetical protein